MQEKINIVNKKANFKYFLKRKYVAGLVLTGLQIKTIKAKKIVIENSYCSFINNELFVFNIVFGNLISEKKSSSKIKLLLNRFELKKIQSESKEVGLLVDKPSDFSGVVVWQSIVPGSDLNKKDICKIKMTN